MERLFRSINFYISAVLYIAVCHLERYMGRAGLILYGTNTITSLIPTLYEALDIVSRELVGFIPAVSRNSSAERAALNQTINIPITPAATTGNVTPGQLPVDDGSQTIGNTTMTISASKYSPVQWTGEEQKAVSSSGMGGSVMTQQFAQSMRALVNLIEADLAALHIYAGSAYGTYNTSPFASAGVFTDFAKVNQLLDEAGAPPGDRQLVLGSGPIAAISGIQSVLFKANEAGTADLLRMGIIGMVEGLAIHKSAQVKKAVAVGSSANATVGTAAYAIGATSLILAATGTGTLGPGDMITIAGDTNIYVVTSTNSTMSGQTVTIQEPGLKVAIAGSASPAITIVAATNRNMGFARSSIQLITRAPALPEVGDMADDRITITDPVSGLSFEVSIYKQYRRVKYEVAIAWGVKVVAPRHVMNLIGPNS